MGAKKRRHRVEDGGGDDLILSRAPMSDCEDSEVHNSEAKESVSVSRQKAKEHASQLQRLQQKDPEFYQYLKDYDKELLEFDDEGFGEEEADIDEVGPPDKEQQKPPAKVITSAMVDSWCSAIKEENKLGAVRCLLRAFHTSCHYGDDGESDSSPKFGIISSGVFNKIMVFVLNEMDGVLRRLLNAPISGGKKETIMELMTTKEWKKHGSLMRVYLGNALHILTQMTDELMISFTLKRVKASAVFLAAFPSLLRKYIKVALHSWGTGRGALPVVSFLFLRDLCVRIGSDCLDPCLKGVYKAYVLNCKLAKSVSRSKLQHINFLGNCVMELCGLDLPSAYQQAFVSIRQLATIFRNALTERGPKAVTDKKKGKNQQQSSKSTKKQGEKAYQKVYDWQFIFCLELWTGVVCAYNSEADFKPLGYPLSQIISGVASLVPTARYFPLRLRCIRMLNRIAGATGTFIPVCAPLLDILEMKELNTPPTGGIGKAVNLLSSKQVDKTTVKTRAFQDACVSSVVEELAEHLTQWSYSVAFFELSFIPLARLRSFCKNTKVDKFRREIKELIRQVEENCEFVNLKRTNVTFSPNDPAVSSFLKVEKESGSSPLSKFITEVRLRARQRNDSMVESSVLVGAESSEFCSKVSEIDDAEDDDSEDAEEGAAVFSSSWMPEKKSKTEKAKSKDLKKRRHHDEEREVGGDEDVVEDLVLSSEDDDENDDGDDDEGEETHGRESPDEEVRKKSKKSLKQGSKQQLATASKKKRSGKPRPKLNKRRKKGVGH